VKYPGLEIQPDPFVYKNKNAGISISEDEATTLLSSASKQRECRLDFEEFAALMATRQLMTVFDEIDVDKSGTINKAEIKVNDSFFFF